MSLVESTGGMATVAISEASSSTPIVPPPRKRRWGPAPASASAANPETESNANPANTNTHTHTTPNESTASSPMELQMQMSHTHSQHVNGQSDGYGVGGNVAVVDDAKSWDPSIDNSSDDAKKRKRSRWGDSAAVNSSTMLPLSDASSTPSPAPGVASSPSPTPAMTSQLNNAAAQLASAYPPFTLPISPHPAHLSIAIAQRYNYEQAECYLVQCEMERLIRRWEKLNRNEVDEEERIRNSNNRARSPSPEPQYDGQGKRTNTRPLRWRASVEAELKKLSDAVREKYPQWNPTNNNTRNLLQTITKRAANQWVEVRLPIPSEKFPGYNFKGQIIGPRGIYQKKLEDQTGCRIAVRGIGSTNKPQDQRRAYPGDDLPLHVLICGPTQEKVDEAIRIVKPLLSPLPEEEKNKQLRELALLNGTLRDVQPCRVCGSINHREKFCPAREEELRRARGNINIRCGYCGSENHLEIDCPLKNGRVEESLVKEAERKAEEIQNEYEKLRQELNADTENNLTQHGAGNLTAEEMYWRINNNNAMHPSRQTLDSSPPPPADGSVDGSQQPSPQQNTRALLPAPSSAYVNYEEKHQQQQKSYREVNSFLSSLDSAVQGKGSRSTTPALASASSSSSSAASSSSSSSPHPANATNQSAASSSSSTYLPPPPLPPGGHPSHSSGYYYPNASPYAPPSGQPFNQYPPPAGGYPYTAYPPAMSSYPPPPHHHQHAAYSQPQHSHYPPMYYPQMHGNMDGAYPPAPQPPPPMTPAPATTTTVTSSAVQPTEADSQSGKS